MNLEKIKKSSLEQNVPIIMDETLEKIKEYLKNKRISKVLEIGTATGYSALCFAKLIEKNGQIDTIERDEERIKIAKKNIKSMKRENQIHIYEGDAVEILPTFNEKYDMIFIDAAKGKYPFFFEQALRLLNKDGIIFADNILYKGYVMSDYNKHKQRTAVTHLREYIKNATQNPEIKTEILEVGDGLGVTTFIC